MRALKNKNTKAAAVRLGAAGALYAHSRIKHSKAVKKANGTAPGSAAARALAAVKDVAKKL